MFFKFYNTLLVLLHGQSFFSKAAGWRIFVVCSCCVCVWVVFLPSLAAFQLRRNASPSALTNIRCHEKRVCGRIWSRIRSDNKSSKRWDTCASLVFHAQKCTSWQCWAIPEKIPGSMPRYRKTQENIREHEKGPFSLKKSSDSWKQTKEKKIIK